MLTDYHVHLRPDDVDATAAAYFTPAHAERYREAGLRKPVGEIYPDAVFLEMCLEAGRPMALSSDAHVPEDLSHEYERAVAWLTELGVTELAVLERRQRCLEPLG